jgi:hypothetical protein
MRNTGEIIIDRQKYLDRNLSHCHHFVHHKPHIDWAGIKPSINLLSINVVYEMWSATVSQQPHLLSMYEQF